MVLEALVYLDPLQAEEDVAEPGPWPELEPEEVAAAVVSELAAEPVSSSAVFAGDL
jgi:hypothetical protein